MQSIHWMEARPRQSNVEMCKMYLINVWKEISFIDKKREYVSNTMAALLFYSNAFQNIEININASIGSIAITPHFQ